MRMRVYNYELFPITLVCWDVSVKQASETSRAKESTAENHGNRSYSVDDMNRGLSVIL